MGYRWALLCGGLLSYRLRKISMYYLQASRPRLKSRTRGRFHAYRVKSGNATAQRYPRLAIFADRKREDTKYKVIVDIDAFRSRIAKVGRARPCVRDAIAFSNFR